MITSAPSKRFERDYCTSRTTRLGSIAPVPPAVVERLFSADFAYLQDLYVRINEVGGNLAETQCPDCGSRFAVDLAGA